MGYQNNFNGALTPELARLLHSAPRQLNWHGIHVEAATDTASAASTVSNCGPGGKDCANSNHGPHASYEFIVVVVIAVVALVVGITIGYALGKRSGSAATKT